MPRKNLLAGDRALQREFSALQGKNQVGRRNNGQATSISGPATKEDLIPLLVNMELAYSFKVQHTENALDTAAYIQRLTATIAELPYKKSEPTLPFCAEEVKPRHVLKSMSDVWAAQLMQIPNVHYIVCYLLLTIQGQRDRGSSNFERIPHFT